MCTYVHSRNHPLQSQPLKASWRSLSVIASILIIDRISPALLLTSHDQDLHIYIYIYWSYGGVFSLLLSPPAPILRANVFSCDRLASAWQMTPAKAAIISRQTRHSLLSWHLKTCWWLMIGLYTATITVGLTPDLSTVEWVNKDKQRLTYQAKWLVSGL